MSGDEATRQRQQLRRVTHYKIHLRDNNQRMHEGPFGRCSEKRWLDIHHVIPVANGGDNRVENLTT